MCGNVFGRLIKTELKIQTSRFALFGRFLPRECLGDVCLCSDHTNSSNTITDITTIHKIAEIKSIKADVS